MLGALAQAERTPVEVNPLLAAAAGDEQLAQHGQQRPRPRAAGRGVMRDVPPAEHEQPFLSGDLPYRLGRGGIVMTGTQERDAGRVAAGLWQREAAGRPVEPVGNLGQDARAVTGVRIAALGPPVVEVAQDGQGLGDDVVAAPPRQVGHEADAARVVLESAVIQAPVLAGRGRGMRGA